MTIDYRQGGTDIQTDSLKLPVFKKALQTGGTDRRTDRQTNIACFQKSIPDRGGHTYNIYGRTDSRTHNYMAIDV